MAACCQTPYVQMEEQAVCGKTLTFSNPEKNNQTDTVLVKECDKKTGKKKNRAMDFLLM